MKEYLYSNTKNNEEKGKYTVYEVEVIKDNRDVAERRARTMARKHNDTLAGGSFLDTCLPYNFITHYRVIKVPLSTRVSPYNKRDKFIISLIEAESGR